MWGGVISAQGDPLDDFVNPNACFVDKGEILDYFADETISKEEKDSPSNDFFRTSLCKMMASDEQDGDNDIDAEAFTSSLMEPDSGATVDFVNKKAITRGFAYSPYPDLSRGIHKDNFKREDIDNYVADNKEVLQQEGNYLGVWHDPDTGIIYLDISTVTNDASEARVGCEEHDQIAFFDMQTFESVLVNREATSGGASNS